MIHDHFTMKNIGTTMNDHATSDHAFVYKIMNHDSWSLFFIKNIATTNDHATLFRIMNS